MKKLISIFVSVFLAISLCFSISPVSFASVSAASAVLSILKDVALSVVLDFCKSFIFDIDNSVSKRTEAARTYYFYKIIKDEYLSGLPILDNSGHKFSSEILDYYYAEYLRAISAPQHNIYDSSGDVFIQAAGYTDTRFSLKLLSFHSDSGFGWASGGGAVNGLSQAEYEKICFVDYYQSMLARFLLENGEIATDPNPGKSGLEIAPAYVSSDEFIEGLELDNTLYFPRNDYRVVSYRNDPTFQRLVKDGKAMSNHSYEPTIIYEGGYLVNKNSPALYFVLFYYDDDIKGYGMYQYKFYIAEEVNEDGSIKKVPHLMRWNCFDETEAEAVEVDFSVQNGMPNFSETCTFKYVRLGFDSSNLIFKCYDTYADYMNNSSNYCYFKASSGNQEYFKCYTTDLSSIFGFFQYCYGNRNHYFMGSLDKHAESCTFKADDVGLITSTEPILLKSYPFDSSKIGKGQIVTINGDTIYNYTITNPETGDSSKFGDYITNNYTYITNNNGGDSSGTGGKVEVGGKIDVGGSVGVDITVSVPDININVNGSGGEGTSLSPSDFTSGDTVDTNKYFDSALEMSENTQNFFGDFFAFLPPEILALILFGLTMAIVCRVGGR